MSLRYLTAGESHGPCVLAVLEGMVSALPLAPLDINPDLARRQGGYGRGQRMKIEKDEVVILSGLRGGRTLGGPIALQIINRDWENWKDRSVASTRVTRPRPGHADLAGAMKYGTRDVRDILERSSARETVARVAVGAVCKKLLAEAGMRVYSRTVSIGSVTDPSAGSPFDPKDAAAIESSPTRARDRQAEQGMIALIDEAKKRGDSLGGVFEVIATGVPPGLGSHVHYDRKLDGRLAQAVMSINAVKGVEVGLGFEGARRFGSQVHDEIFFAKGRGFFRKTNRAGGTEGGMTTGEPLVVRVALKPISTLYKPLRSVDLVTKKPFLASVERSDTCSVPAAEIIGEAVVAFELARAALEKFGGDSLREFTRNHAGYLRQVAAL